MASFMETSRATLARMGRHLADRILFDRAGYFFSQAEGMKPTAQYRQPFRLIPGMPAAPEPCALPQHWSEADHPFDAAAQPKLDGIRAIYVDTTIVSREALPLDCALHCLPALHDLEALYGEKMVFDGEYLEPGGFQATLAAMKAGEGVGSIWLFDAVPYREWKANRFSERLDQRVRKLCQMQERLGSPFVHSLGLTFVPDPAAALDLARQEWARGGEGVVVKSRGSVYVRGKTKTWLKLKKAQTFDGTIVDVVVEGDRAKAILVRMPDDSPSPGKVVKIGSNIPDDMREALARGAEQFQGDVVEIGFNDTTDTGNLRGGYFIRMRDDKTGDRHG